MVHLILERHYSNLKLILIKNVKLEKYTITVDKDFIIMAKSLSSNKNTHRIVLMGTDNS